MRKRERRNTQVILFGIFRFGSVLLVLRNKLYAPIGSVHKKILCMLSANSGVLLHLSVSGMFSGFGWLAFGRIFGLGARFGVYEILTAFCKGKLVCFYCPIPSEVCYL
jgi:hypothetical protein